MDETPVRGAAALEQGTDDTHGGTTRAQAIVTTHDDLYTRLRPLYGEGGLGRLRGARVLLLGLGGVGSSCAEALARGGVGELYLLDRDIVEPSNLNRQALAFTSTLGRRKVDVMGEMVARINPACRVEARHRFVTRDDLPELLAWAGAEVAGAPATCGNVATDTAAVHRQGDAPDMPTPARAPIPIIVGAGRIDYVVDAIDTVSQKLALAELCWAARIPLVSSMGAANKLHPELLEFSDVRRTRMCRMARTMRRECARRGVRHLEVLYSPEPPVRPRQEAGSSHGGLPNLGTASFMPPIMGQMLAGRVIRALVGAEPWPWGGDA